MSSRHRKQPPVDSLLEPIPGHPDTKGRWKALLCIVPFTQEPRISLAAPHNCSLPRSCTRRAHARFSSPAGILTEYSLQHGFSHQHRRRQCQRSVLSLQDAEAAGSGESSAAQQIRCIFEGATYNRQHISSTTIWRSSVLTRESHRHQWVLMQYREACVRQCGFKAGTKLTQRILIHFTEVHCVHRSRGAATASRPML